MMSSLLPTSQIRKIIENVEDEKYRYALMYQFLIGGSVSEICGKYKPKGTDATQKKVKINDKTVPAVFFKIKTVRRKGKLRICAIPLDKEYEPWSKDIFNWFKKHGENYPFVLFEKSIDSINNDKYLMKKTNELFKSYKQPTKEYLRNARKKNLKEFYQFNELDLALFGLWNEPVIEYSTRMKIRNILSSTGRQRDESELMKMSEMYLNKLLRPIRHLEQEDVPLYLQVRNSIDFSSRYKRAAQITNNIKNINDASLLLLNAPFFNEKMRMVLDILNPCDDEEQFQSKIITLATLFEVERDTLRIAGDKHFKGQSFRLIERWLQYNDIPYDPEILTTWVNIRDLRNEMAHYKRNTKKFFKILSYFEQPIQVDINWSNTWDVILEKFNVSLENFKDVLDSLPKIIGYKH